MLYYSTRGHWWALGKALHRPIRKLFGRYQEVEVVAESVRNDTAVVVDVDNGDRSLAWARHSACQRCEHDGVLVLLVT